MFDIEELVKATRQKALDTTAITWMEALIPKDSREYADTWTVELVVRDVLALCDEIDRLRVERDALRAFAQEAIVLSGPCGMNYPGVRELALAHELIDGKWLATPLLTGEQQT